MTEIEKSLSYLVFSVLSTILLHGKLLRPAAASDVKKTRMLTDVMESDQFNMNKLRDVARLGRSSPPKFLVSPPIRVQLIMQF